MARSKYRWQDHKQSTRRIGEFTQAGDVTITKVDGTVEVKPPHATGDEILESVGTRGARKRQPRTGGPKAPRQMVARIDSRCNYCGNDIHAGDHLGWNPNEETGFCWPCSTADPGLLKTRGRKTV